MATAVADRTDGPRRCAGEDYFGVVVDDDELVPPPVLLAPLLEPELGVPEDDDELGPLMLPLADPVPVPLVLLEPLVPPAAEPVAPVPDVVPVPLVLPVVPVVEPEEVVSVVVVEELEDVAGGVGGVLVVVLLLLELPAGGDTTVVLSLRSQPAMPAASASASALVTKILDFMWELLSVCRGRERTGGAALQPFSLASSVPSPPRCESKQSQSAAPRRLLARRRDIAHALSSAQLKIFPLSCNRCERTRRRRKEKPRESNSPIGESLRERSVQTRTSNSAAAAALPRKAGHGGMYAHPLTVLPEDSSEASMPVALIVDDDDNARVGLKDLVEAEGFAALTAANLAEAREAMAKQPDIVLLDLMLPDGNGLDLLRDTPVGGDMQVVVTTGHATLETSIDALRLGATDYLLKPVNVAHLKAILSRVAGPAELRAEVSQLREELRKLGRFGKLVGTSPPMQKLYDEIARVAPTSATVLIMGESGTGKELVAETIHMLSRRHNKPFLAVNCGAISPHLIESELFGHEKGSFTGANRQHQGYFERAHGGTLFLDEITEMPLELQVKLLRVLESRTVVRVGSNQLIETDVRVIAATNRNADEAVKQGKLRRDLLYRLQVFPLHVVPLRERLDDVGPLARHFLAELNKRAQTDKTFSPMALERMRRYRWPGNVRELWNVVQRAFIMADGDIISEFSVAQDAQLQQDGQGGYIRIPLGTKLAEVEERLILTTLQECTTREEAAKKLGISIKTLYNRLRAYSQRQ